MDTIKLLNKKTGKVGEYDIFIGHIPQFVYVDCGGVATGFSSLEKLAEVYEIVKEEK